MIKNILKSLVVISALSNPLVADDNVYVNWASGDDYKWKELKNPTEKDSFVHRKSLDGNITHKLWEIGSGDKGYVLITEGTISAKLALGTGASAMEQCELATNSDLAKTSTIDSCVSMPVKLELMENKTFGDDVIQTFYVNIAAKVKQTQTASYLGMGGTKFKAKFKLRHIITDIRNTTGDYYVRISARDAEVESEDAKSEYTYEGNGSDGEVNFDLFKK